MTLSTAMIITARVAVTGFLTVSCFKRAVVDNTAQVLSKAEKASVGLAVYSVCLSTITLVLAADKAAQRIISDETKHIPAATKDVDADSSLLSANDATTSVAPQPVQSSHLQPFPSLSQSRLIESVETVTTPISTCTPNDNPPGPATLKSIEPYYLQPSPTSSPSYLIESTETTSTPVTCSNTCSPCITLTSPDLYCKRLSIDSSITLVLHDDDCESCSDKSSIHGDDHFEPQPRKEHAPEPTFEISIAKMTALVLDNPPRPSKLRPLILVNNCRKTSTTIPCPPLPEPAYSIDALTRRMEARSLSDSPPTEPGISLPESGCPIDALTRNMEALSLGDRLSSTSKLKPLILVTKRATRHFKLPPLITTPTP